MRPYVICHMISSLDGRIKSEGCPQEFYGMYQHVENLHEADGWICGRITIEDFIGTARFVHTNASYDNPRNDFIARKDGPYGVVIDPSGKLAWTTNTVNNAHIIVALTENVSDDYLEFLQDKGISYIFGGKTEIALDVILEKLEGKFHVKKLLLEGGGKMNGSMLREGLIDELSLLIAPAIEGSIGAPSIFDVNETRQSAVLLKLISIKQLEHNILWLTYQIAQPEKVKLKQEMSAEEMGV